MADQRDEAVSKKAHCARQIHYHIVFPVKYRKSLLDEAVTTIIRETAAKIAERFPIEMEAIRTDQHNIHLLCSAHPKMAPAGLCRYSRALRRGRSFAESLRWGGEFWTAGYYVATMGERATWQIVERYVQR